MTFEEAFERLKEIVSIVEKSNVNIENIVNLVEEGNALSKLCDDKLKAIEKQISIIEK
ncbi:MAG: exodeoxyribonuclease VII small subunit [Candidatus Marinimicrobia bacterium]|nr:exodeoxyribonuclease VII small subunit [Candidatus Neomarinimicrobiota bacterium]